MVIPGMGEGRGKGVPKPAEKKEAEEADKVEVAPGVTVASLMRRFRAALVGPTQGLPKRRRLCRWRRSLKTLRVRCLKKNLNVSIPSEHPPVLLL